MTSNTELLSEGLVILPSETEPRPGGVDSGQRLPWRVVDELSYEAASPSGPRGSAGTKSSSSTWEPSAQPASRSETSKRGLRGLSKSNLAVYLPVLRALVASPTPLDRYRGIASGAWRDIST